MTRYTDEWYAADPRFDAIAEVLDSGPPGRVLDFGALRTVTAEKLTARYSAASVVVVDDTITDAGGDRIEVVRKRVTPAGITALGGFDAVLALSVLHHLSQWRRYVAVLRDAAPLLFVETANPAEDLPNAKAHKHSGDIAAHLASIGEPLCLSPGYDSRFERTLWVVRS